MYIPSALFLVPAILVASVQADQLLPRDAHSVCDCTNTNASAPTKPPSICNDPRLGPVQLPTKLPLLSFVDNYNRFGNLTPGEFLAKFTNKTNGWWIYPPADGFSLDMNGQPIKGNMTLGVGTKIDRFGYESGRYVSAADAPFNQRSLPPDSLDTDVNGTYPYNYHIYTVKKELPVIGGPIAPWFGQPGLGAQFYVGGIGNITMLIDLGYLERLPKSDIEPGPGPAGGCGR